MKPTNHHINTVIILSVLGASLLAASAAAAQEKALDANYRVYFLRDGREDYVDVKFPGAIKIPDFNGYCGCVTSKGNPYAHAHQPDWPDDSYHVARSEVEAWFAWTCPDEFIEPGTASFTENCHGYTTGKGQWIFLEPNAIGVILDDEYKDKLLLLGGRYAFEEPASTEGITEHSFIITDVCTDNSGTSCAPLGTYMTGMREKDGWGPIKWPVIYCEDKLTGIDSPVIGDDYRFVVKTRL